MGRERFFVLVGRVPPRERIRGQFLGGAEKSDRRPYRLERADIGDVELCATAHGARVLLERRLEVAGSKPDPG